MIIIDNLLSEVKNCISDVSGTLKTSPAGTLCIKHIDKTVRYYQINKNDTKKQYLGRNCRQKVRALEEKAYLTELLKVAKQEESVLERVQRILESMPDYKTVFLNIPPERRHLIRPYENVLPKTDKHIRFECSGKRSVPDDIKLITQNGEHVRSKSELIIADRLKAAGVPYYYENPLMMIMPPDKSKFDCYEPEISYWHPDFTVLNKTTGKQYLWEHFGMLENAEYCVSCQRKLEIYAQHGYFPGENLIISSESLNHGLNLEYVDLLIDRYLK